MKELKNAYSDIRPSQALVEDTKRRLRLEREEKNARRFSPGQLLKLAPALCAVVLAAAIALPRTGGGNAATVPPDDYGLSVLSLDPVFDEMTALSGGKVFLKLEGRVVVSGKLMAIEIISVTESLGVEISYLPGERLWVSHSWDPMPQPGAECTLWLYADEVGQNWNGYEYFVN